MRAAHGLTAALLLVASAQAADIAQERVSFESAALTGAGARVEGELRLPPGAGQVPAVLVLHTSGGYKHDGVSEGYIKALNEAGIGTLWLYLFPTRSARPRSTRELMPHAYGSLLYLVEHPRVDPQGIGVIGFSYGGVMSLAMASQELTQEFTGGKARFAAHIALYPVCYIHEQLARGQNLIYPASTYRKFTGAPVHILTGEKDAYDAPDSCAKFVAVLPEAERGHFGVTVYPGAYHLFDEPGINRQHHDPMAALGRGGRVAMYHDAGATAKSRAFAVQFFENHLGAGK